MKKWRKWFWAIHRDLGYFFFATTVIYAISGIAINHIQDWNPNFIITTQEFTFNMPEDNGTLDKEFILGELSENDIQSSYKKHYFPSEDVLKIFLKDGSVMVDITNGDALYESIRKRPVFHTFNYLHYNPHKYWTWFSDAYAIALFLLAVTGLFLLRGKKGIIGRGAWLTALGIIIPIIFLLIYY